MRRNPRTGARATGRGIGRSHIWISPVIDIQKRPLRALEQNLFPALQEPGADKRPYSPRTDAALHPQQIIAVYLLVVDWFSAKRLQDAVVLPVFGLQLFREQSWLHQVGDPQTGSRRFIAVGRSDATFGRADFRAPFPQFALLVERAMVRQNQMGAVADQKILVDLDADFGRLRSLAPTPLDRSPRRCRSRKLFRGAKSPKESDGGCKSCRRG